MKNTTNWQGNEGSELGGLYGGRLIGEWGAGGQIGQGSSGEGHLWWRGGEGKLNRINTESDWPTKQAEISLAHLQFCLEILIIIYLHLTNIDWLNNNAIILYLYSSKCMQNMTIQRFENRSINIHHYINGWFCTFSTRPTKINDWVKTVQIDTQCLPYLASLLP